MVCIFVFFCFFCFCIFVNILLFLLLFYYMTIPIIIVCYNNYKYVDNTIKQINNINPDYTPYITIMDNNSYDEETINFLKNTSTKVIFNKTNDGPWIRESTNKHVYDILPDKFILTDPDLELNENIPKNFIEQMLELSEKYDCNKIGFALKIDDYDKMFQYPNYTCKQNIRDWESQFWRKKINNPNYELYYADIDTTFCLYNKKYNNNQCEYNIRIAGNFTAIHLPWYRENKIYTPHENYIMSTKQTRISTISKIITESYTTSNT